MTAKATPRNPWPTSPLDPESAVPVGLEVDSFYRTYLHRSADPAGRAGWVQAMLDGMSENEVILHFLNSAE
jgi:Domain of unknown function (DUF4214)